MMLNKSSPTPLKFEIAFDSLIFISIFFNIILLKKNDPIWIQFKMLRILLKHTADSYVLFHRNKAKTNTPPSFTR
jgi:hypothetical protein